VDILVPFIVGLVAAGIIWGVANILDRKRLAKKANIEIDEDLYLED
jgi:phosphotransferase system  glucose/maltose/N-acetylglucosamine-specific IIC component